MKRALEVWNYKLDKKVLLGKRRLWMKKGALIIVVLFFLFGCGKDKGWIRVWLIDEPPPQDVQEIDITVMAVGARNSKGEVVTLADYPYTVDIVKLSGGRCTPLSYSPKYVDFVEVEAGDYTSVMLILAEVNYVVRDSVADSLLIPINPEDSMPKILYELEEDFTVFPGQQTTLVVDFDASKSINWESKPYKLTPFFRIFELSLAGFIKGTVKDSSGAAIRLALLEAANSVDTFATLTDTLGEYSFAIPEGYYNISASAEGYTKSDTVYEVTVNRTDVLDGYDFMLK
jgi:hypothetical protein